MVGDHMGILGAVGFFFLFPYLLRIFTCPKVRTGECPSQNGTCPKVFHVETTEASPSDWTLPCPKVDGG
jgi:hypothetical protein